MTLRPFERGHHLPELEEALPALAAPEFRPWPKIARLNRTIIITEKIDGTNGCVIVMDDGRVFAQSRKRIITPDADNFGFARWVYANAEQLADDLGPGYHYGEWHGQGIQRGYGLDHKRFALFNAQRWKEPAPGPNNVDVVPVLYHGEFNSTEIKLAEYELRVNGSRINGFRKPEGIVVHFAANRTNFKVLLENDDIPKGPQ